ncbi:MAG TPA: adenylate kinase [Acidimicrobiales bacterium]|nr:adenylate kinase [Acidimicrobiales bacterium]
MRLLMVAAPGAGKGTQAARLSSYYGVAHISSGELFRKEVADGSVIGKIAAAYLKRGDLVPDDLVMQMLAGPVLRAAQDGGYVLDGFPRTLRQAEEAYAWAKQVEGVELQAVVHLVVSRKELLGRLSARAQEEGRSDDTIETIEHRLDVYDSETEPLIDYYAGRGLVVDINGEQPVHQVFEDIVNSIESVRAGRR